MTWILFNAVVSCAEWFWSTSITITNLDCIFRLPSSLLHPPSPFFSFYFPPPLPSPDVFLPLYFLHLFFFRIHLPSPFILFGWQVFKRMILSSPAGSAVTALFSYERLWLLRNLMGETAPSFRARSNFVIVAFNFCTHGTTAACFSCNAYRSNLHRHTNNTPTQAHTHDPTYSMPLLL